MSKKIISLILAFAVLFTAVMPMAFAQDNALGKSNGLIGSIDFQDSDRVRQAPEDTIGAVSIDNPFGAVKKSQYVEEQGFSLLSENGTIQVSNNKLSMTEAREIDVIVDLGYAPELENLKWTLGGLSFSEWKKWNNQARNYTGAPFITFVGEPVIEGTVVKAKIKSDLVYGTVNLSSSTYRRAYPALIGVYALEVEDTSTGAKASVDMKLNVYDAYHTYDELKPAVDAIFSKVKVKADRYLEYQVIGQSVEGRDLHFIILAKDKESVEKYLNETVPLMLENPQELQNRIKNGTIGDYKVPIFVNNIHPDEAPGIDAQLTALEMLATKDVIEFLTTDEEKNEVEVQLDVDELLDNIIILMNLTENPDGRYYNTRANVNGFDVNRDNGYQTQVESRIVVRQIAKWNPISFLDLHGFVAGFLIEPCTPPHDPNYEYDLLMKGMIDEAHAMGRAGIANTKYNSYLIPLFDYDSGWDDATPAYTATYAMHHGAMGHTIEIPELNQDSHDTLVYAIMGAAKFVLDGKDELFLNQLEYFRRGVEGIDDRSVDKWLVNAKGESIGRNRGNNDNYFPDYYVLPVAESLQKNPLEVYNIVEYLLRNGIKVDKTTEAVVVNGKEYPAGTYVVNMRQAKRGYANAVLSEGFDVSDFDEMYAEIVMSFPALRGFDIDIIRTPNVFDGKTQKVDSVSIPSTIIKGSADQYVIRNSNNHAVKAVNELLSQGKKVKYTIKAGEGYGIGEYIVNREDLEAIKDKYFLQIVEYNGKSDAVELKQPKVYDTGSGETKFVLRELGFNLVENKQEADVIVDSSGSGTKQDIEAGKSYIGIGMSALNFIKRQGILPGFDYAFTNSYHEGLIKGKIATDNLITAGYSEDELLYTAAGAWISSVPEDAKVLASVSDEEDFYIAGWWPGNEQAKGKALAITQNVGDAKVTVFANTITNKAHPQNSFRFLANAIFASVNEKPEYTLNTSFNMDSLKPDKMLNATVLATNNTDDESPVLVIVALYDQQETMENVSYISKVVQRGVTEKLIAGFKLPSNIDGYKVKVFVWDGVTIETSSMKPLSEVVILE